MDTDHLWYRIDKAGASSQSLLLSPEECKYLSDISEFWQAKSRGATAQTFADYEAARQIIQNAVKKPHSWWDDEQNVAYIKTIERLVGA